MESGATNLLNDHAPQAESPIQIILRRNRRRDAGQGRPMDLPIPEVDAGESFIVGEGPFPSKARNFSNAMVGHAEKLLVLQLAAPLAEPPKCSEMPSLRDDSEWSSQ